MGAKRVRGGIVGAAGDVGHCACGGSKMSGGFFATGVWM